MAIPFRLNGLMEGDDVGELPEYAIFEEDGIMEIAPYSTYKLELHAAVLHADVDGLRLALDNLAGGSIDQGGEDGETPLHLACRYGNRSCAKLLLERGASLEVKDKYGVTPLHDVCNIGSVKIMELLLNSARDSECVKKMVKAVDRKGETPLHYAARRGFVQGIRLLLVSGADPTKTNTSGKVPGELACPESEAEKCLKSAASAVEFNLFLQMLLGSS